MWRQNPLLGLTIVGHIFKTSRNPKNLKKGYAVSKEELPPSCWTGLPEQGPCIPMGLAFSWHEDGICQEEPTLPPYRCK